MKEDILRLRSEGYSYKEIKTLLGCSISTISYHCGEGQKEKQKLRRVIYKENISTNSYLRKRISFFQKRDDQNKYYDKTKKFTFTVKEFIDKFGLITECALTGIKINLETDRNWEIDHIISKSQGGDNSLDNCQILLKSVNQMKNSLSEERLIELCRLIIKKKDTAG